MSSWRGWSLWVGGVTPWNARVEPTIRLSLEAEKPFPTAHSSARRLFVLCWISPDWAELTCPPSISLSRGNGARGLAETDAPVLGLVAVETSWRSPGRICDKTRASPSWVRLKILPFQLFQLCHNTSGNDATHLRSSWHPLLVQLLSSHFHGGRCEMSVTFGAIRDSDESPCIYPWRPGQFRRTCFMSSSLSRQTWQSALIFIPRAVRRDADMQYYHESTTKGTRGARGWVCFSVFVWVCGLVNSW